MIASDDSVLPIFPLGSRDCGVFWCFSKFRKRIGIARPSRRRRLATNVHFGLLSSCILYIKCHEFPRPSFVPLSSSPDGGLQVMPPMNLLFLCLGSCVFFPAAAGEGNYLQGFQGLEGNGLGWGGVWVWVWVWVQIWLGDVRPKWSGGTL